MSTAARLGVYGAGLVVVFGAAFAAGAGAVPERTVRSWTQAAEGHDVNTSKSASGHGDPQGHGGSTGTGTAAVAASVPGVTSAQGGYLITPVTVPTTVGDAGKLSLRILDARGVAVTNFATSHEKKLHLIVVRTDGTRFRHVHPVMAVGGTWSLPWEWAATGSYRVYADFIPAADAGGGTLTLTRTVEVAGRFSPVAVAAAAAANDTASVGGFIVRLTGDLVAGSSSHLTFSVTRNGEPVTSLQPYLGAFGHLVALREGDLAFLHVHPEGEDPSVDGRSGPKVEFAVEAPTPGRYLLYLDFQVDGTVHSAPFVVDAGSIGGPATVPAPVDGHADPRPSPTSPTVTGSHAGDGHGRH